MLLIMLSLILSMLLVGNGILATSAGGAALAALRVACAGFGLYPQRSRKLPTESAQEIGVVFPEF
jgi:hypothetical protein